MWSNYFDLHCLHFFDNLLFFLHYCLSAFSSQTMFIHCMKNVPGYVQNLWVFFGKSTMTRAKDGWERNNSHSKWKYHHYLSFVQTVFKVCGSWRCSNSHTAAFIPHHLFSGGKEEKRVTNVETNATMAIFQLHCIKLFCVPLDSRHISFFICVNEAATSDGECCC